MPEQSAAGSGTSQSTSRGPANAHYRKRHMPEETDFCELLQPQPTTRSPAPRSPAKRQLLHRWSSMLGNIGGDPESWQKSMNSSRNPRYTASSSPKLPTS